MSCRDACCAQLPPPLVDAAQLNLMSNGLTDTSVGGLARMLRENGTLLLVTVSRPPSASPASLLVLPPPRVSAVCSAHRPASTEAHARAIRTVTRDPTHAVGGWIAHCMFSFAGPASAKANGSRRP